MISGSLLQKQLLPQGWFNDMKIVKFVIIRDEFLLKLFFNSIKLCDFKEI